MKKKPKLHNPFQWSPWRLMLSLGFGVAVLSAVGAQRIRRQSITQPAEFAGPFRRAEHV